MPPTPPPYRRPCGSALWRGQPYGAQVLARHPPMAILGKLTMRAKPAIYMHRSTRTIGGAHVGLLDRDKVRGHANRRTVRAVLGKDGRGAIP